MGRLNDPRENPQQRDDWGNPIHRRVLLGSSEPDDSRESGLASEGMDEELDEVLHPEDDGDLL
jgi:hypothetical protein